MTTEDERSAKRRAIHRLLALGAVHDVGFSTLRERIEAAIMIGIGAGSACWSNLIDAGVFNSDAAVDIGDGIVDGIVDAIVEVIRPFIEERFRDGLKEHA